MPRSTIAIAPDGKGWSVTAPTRPGRSPVSAAETEPTPVEGIDAGVSEVFTPPRGAVSAQGQYAVIAPGRT